MWQKKRQKKHRPRCPSSFLVGDALRGHTPVMAKVSQNLPKTSGTGTQPSKTILQLLGWDRCRPLLAWVTPVAGHGAPSRCVTHSQHVSPCLGMEHPIPWGCWLGCAGTNHRYLRSPCALANGKSPLPPAHFHHPCLASRDHVDKQQQRL